MRCKLTLILEEQPEGGFTITCQKLPELITECDSLDKDEIKEVVTDAFYAIVELYDHQHRSLPEELQILGDNTEDAEIKRRRSGSHRIGEHPQTKLSASIPDWGSRDLRIGTLRSTLKQLEIDSQTFLDN